MAVNNIDSLNNLHHQALTAKQEEYVQEAEVDGIEILVDMAKHGKIDPWNVDIVEVTDKYLMHLFQSKAQNLRLTGRTLLFAAILLKLKSNVLEGLDVLDFEPQPEIDLEYDADTLKLEYIRDKEKGMNPQIPVNYFPDDDPTKEPVVNWRSAGQLLWTNWINYYVYQTTPYDVNEVENE